VYAIIVGISVILMYVAYVMKGMETKRENEKKN